MEIRTLRDSELEQALELGADAFHASEDQRESFRRFVDPARVVGAFEGDRLLAMSGVVEFGQYFGGRSVPMGGLASVAVAPDVRGRGLAGQVIRPCIEAMRECGEAISSLYPATTSLYRSVGWEVAGNLSIRSVEPRLLRSLPCPQGGGVRPFVEADRLALRACYDRFASSANGCLDRPTDWWERREVGWKGGSVYVFEGQDGALEGYLVYRQTDGEYTDLGGEFRIVVDELVNCTHDAGLGLWGLLASWSSQVEKLVFSGATDDAILLSMPEQVFQTLAEIRWMTRIVDVEAAIAARGFPSGLDVELSLQLRDEDVASNRGRFRLTVQKGRGQLAQTDSGGGPCLDGRGLSRRIVPGM